MFDMRPLADIGSCVTNARLAHDYRDMMQAQLTAQQQMLLQNTRPLYGLELLNWLRPNVPEGWADWYATGDALV